jgi:hypothetical protein
MSDPSDDFFRAKEVSVDSEGIHINLTNGTSLDVPLTERLKKGTPEQRNNWRFIAEGIGIHWPELDEDLNVDELYRDLVASKPLMRDCRFCQERSRWNSNTCDNCGKERWNDPDDTDLGRSLGEAERESYQIAMARVKLDRSFKKLVDSNDE